MTNVILKTLSPCAEIRAELGDLTTGEWDQLIELGAYHRILPQLQLFLQDVSIPDPIREQLEEALQVSTQQNLLLAAEEKRLLNALSLAGIHSRSFKGPELARKLYGNLVYRQCYDLDLLVSGESLWKARQVLDQLGYRPEDVPPRGSSQYWDRYRYEQGFVHEKHGARVELHWRLMPAFFPFSLTIEDLLAGDDHELLAVALIAHGTRHSWSHLCWLADIAALLALDGFDRKRFHDLAVQYHAVDMVKLALNLVHRIPGTVVLEVTKLSVDLADYGDTIAAGWLDPSEPPAGGADYGLYAAVRERRVDRIKMYRQLLFQPTQADFEWFSLPPGFRWLYALCRPLRLVQRKFT